VATFVKIISLKFQLTSRCNVHTNPLNINYPFTLKILFVFIHIGLQSLFPSAHIWIIENSLRSASRQLSCSKNCHHEMHPSRCQELIYFSLYASRFGSNVVVVTYVVLKSEDGIGTTKHVLCLGWRSTFFPTKY
jgi:hypothetical protein